MNHKKIAIFVFLSFLCFLGNMTSAWADNETQPSSHYIVSEVAAEDTYEAEDTTEYNNETALSLTGEKSWEQGFDIRLHVGFAGLFVDGSDIAKFVGSLVGNPQTEPSIASYLGGHIGGELGYRWKYGGIYFKLGFSPLALAGYSIDNSATSEEDQQKEEQQPKLWPDFNLLAKFYVPLVDDWELVLDLGVGLTTVLFNIQVGVGANWHIWDMTLGFEVGYQRGIASIAIFDISTNLVLATFVLGYTF